MKKILILLLVIPAVLGTVWAFEFWLTGRVDQILKTQAAKVSDFADISWRSVELRPAQLGIVLRKASVRTALGQRVEIEQILLAAAFRFPVTFDHAAVKMDGIAVVEIPGLAAGRAPGPDDVDLFGIRPTLYLEAAYDDARSRLTIHNFRLKAASWGQVLLELMVDRFNPRKLSDLKLETLKIQRMDMTYEDMGLLRRLISKEEKSIAEFRQFMAEAVRLSVDPSDETDEAAQPDGMSGLRDFFEQPGRFSMTLHLKKPVGISQIINARRVSDLLGMMDYRFTNA